MKTVVLDASVAAKWFLPPTGETFTDEAFSLLDRYEVGEISFLVPDLFWAEIANVLWKSVRLGRIPRPGAETALTVLSKRRFPTVPSLELLENAFQIAADFQRAVYDSLYLALAIQTNSLLITADERFANAVAAFYPVKWLGAVV